MEIDIDSSSVIATLSTTDADASDIHTYELVSGDGDTDNSYFTIDGNELNLQGMPKKCSISIGEQSSNHQEFPFSTF